MAARGRAARFVTILRTDVLIQIVDGGKRLNPAQRAVTAALLIGGGDSPTGPVRPSELGSAGFAAARRFAALPASARHAWLAAHLVALRAGHVTLQELP